MRTVLMTMTALAATTMFTAERADACSIAGPSLDGQSAPESGAVGFPTNGMIAVSEQGFDRLSAIARLVDEDGNETLPAVLDDDGALVIAPDALLPDTHYTLFLDALDSGETMGRNEPIELTTGSADDTTPPSTEALATPTGSFRAAPMPWEGVMSCGSFSSTEDSYWLAFSAPIADDDSAVAGYRVYLVDDGGGRTFRAAAIAGEGDGTTYVQMSEGPGTYTFVADVFDLAGNTTSTEPIVVNLVRPIVGDDPVADDPLAVGCAHVALDDDGLPLASVALLVVALARRARRRR